MNIMSFTWIQAIKQYAKENNTQFIIPKRDSELYHKVKATQDKMNATPDEYLPKKPVKEVKKPKVVAEVVKEVAKEVAKVEPVAEAPVKVVRRKKEVKVEEAPVKAERKPRVSKKSEVDEGEVAPVKAERKPRASKKSEVVEGEVAKVEKKPRASKKEKPKLTIENTPVVMKFD